jgi:hypothetical protein
VTRLMSFSAENIARAGHLTANAVVKTLPACKNRQYFCD